MRPGGSPSLPLPTAALVAFAAAVLAAFASAALAPATLAASPLSRPAAPADLQVEGGEERWHSDRRFHVFWQSPDPTVAAVHYRLRAPGGEVAMGPARIPWPATRVERMDIVGPPGAYTVEVWFEDRLGITGPPATAKLRVDDQHPGTVEPLAPTSWIGRADFPLTIGFRRPGGALPVSGIRGYAIAVAPLPGEEPCRAGDRCSDAETDLHRGLADDAYRIAGLPEGAAELRVVAVSGSGMASPVPGRARLQVDLTSPSVTLRGAPTGWTNRAVTLVATAADGGSGMEPGDGVAPFTAIAVDDETVAKPGATATATLIGEGVHRVAYYARDLAGNVDDGTRSNGIVNESPAGATVRIDRRAPRASFTTAQLPSEPELIRVRASDALSGIDGSRGWIGVRRAGSGQRFAALPPAHPGRGGELRARWDSDSHPAGEYQFVYDAAGNATVTTQRADGRPMRLRNPLKTTTALTTGLGRGGETKRTLPFGRSVRIRGRLLTAAGTPLAGQRLRVLERVAGEGAPFRATTATSGSGGAFEVAIDPGPSREIVVQFAGTPTLARASSPAVRLAVRGSVSLRASSRLARVGGAPVVFAGRVATARGVPVRARSVQLQFRLPGLPWREFRTLKTDRRGRFRYAYRFSDDDSRGAVFQFRAYAPAQDGWPYEPAGSRPVEVRGR